MDSMIGFNQILRASFCPQITKLEAVADKFQHFLVQEKNNHYFRPQTSSSAFESVIRAFVDGSKIYFEDE